MVTVNPIPGTPTIFDGESCGTSIVALSVGGAPAGGDYNWYESDNGGAVFNTGTTYDTPSLSVTTSYWVSIVSAEGCEGSRAEIVAAIHDIPAPPSGVDGNRCGDGSGAGCGALCSARHS